ncbi:LOW QUALITY PROTEIN: uncharacterized protein EMH_0057240 [Eimeria mitis]|uniref:Uncharacterized protein n=1 Tax=Eimeria mitis TaxID=44415 RepID=U6KJN2_9EIME|nr:LOW QUALITY PROTEIN: uncharacterized protein EMH_0057240 [Eimeria mitis]CDJ36462.1 hypothetical protein, conserved [Eimeria mitis]
MQIPLRMCSRFNLQRSAAVGENTCPYKWIFYVFARETDPPPKVLNSTRASLTGEAKARFRVTASSVCEENKQGKGNENTKPTSTAPRWSDNVHCGDQVFKRGLNPSVGKVRGASTAASFPARGSAEGTGSLASAFFQASSGAQSSARPFENVTATPEDKQNLLSCVPKGEENLISHGIQRDPEYFSSLDDTSAAVGDKKMDQQRELNAHMFGEAAVHAVLTARKLRRKQENERESQLAKIRIEYAKERKTVEDSVRNRLLQENSARLPMHISDEQEMLTARAPIPTSDTAVRP